MKFYTKQYEYVICEIGFDDSIVCKIVSLPFVKYIARAVCFLFQGKFIGSSLYVGGVGDYLYFLSMPQLALGIVFA